MPTSNKYGAPLPLVRAVEMETYDKGEADLSATELISPPQVVRLLREHSDVIVEDVADEIWKLLGSGVHVLLDAANEDLGLISEERLHATVNGSVVTSGKYDLYHLGIITDWKVTSVFTVREGPKPEWEQQLNIYAWLRRMNDMPVHGLEVVAIFRDWMKSRRGKGTHPVAPFERFPIKLWSVEEQQAFVEARVALHTADEVEPCTDAERWASGAWLWEKGKESKKLNTWDEAHEYVAKKGGAYRKVEPKYVRCADWCAAAPYCPQWAVEKGASR